MDEAPIAEPGEGEVLVHVRTTGICGSDLHFWKHGGIGSLTVDGDCILGHEAAGVVLAKGSGVDHLEIGMWPPFFTPPLSVLGDDHTIFGGRLAD
jgi:L-iditol 2-dehydrogenase